MDVHHTSAIHFYSNTSGKTLHESDIWEFLCLLHQIRIVTFMFCGNTNTKPAVTFNINLNIFTSYYQTWLPAPTNVHRTVGNHWLTVKPSSSLTVKPVWLLNLLRIFRMWITRQCRNRTADVIRWRGVSVESGNHKAISLKIHARLRQALSPRCQGSWEAKRENTHGWARRWLSAFSSPASPASWPRRALDPWIHKEDSVS